MEADQDSNLDKQSRQSKRSVNEFERAPPTAEKPAPKLKDSSRAVMPTPLGKEISLAGVDEDLLEVVQSFEKHKEEI